MKNQNGGLKYPCLTFTTAMQCLDAKISLVPSIVPHSTFNLISPCNTNPNRQSHKATKIHMLTPLTKMQMNSVAFIVNEHAGSPVEGAKA